MLFRAIRATRRRNGKNRTLRLSKDHSSLKNAPECDYSSFYVTTRTGTPAALVAQDLALLTKVRTPVHEERAPYRTLFSVSCVDPFICSLEL
jgi:hypothetical protein